MSLLTELDYPSLVPTTNLALLTELNGRHGRNGKG